MPKAVFNISYTSAQPPKYLQGEDRAAYVAQRNFYNLTSEYNFFSYILNGEKVVKNADAEHYFTREGTNSGLFNLQGALDKDRLSVLKSKLANTQSTIWHGFISFDQETTKGFTTQEQAIKFMRQTFGAFLERTHLNPKNIEMYCALHDDKAHHHHIHFAFFEKEPKRRDKAGKLTYTKKGKFSSKAIDNYLVSANMHLSDHADDYYTARDAAMDRLREIRHDVARQTSRQRRESELGRAIYALSRKMPENGRLQYRSSNVANLRPEIDRVAALVVNIDPKMARAQKQVLQQLARIEAATTDLVKNNRLAYYDGQRMTKPDIDRTVGVKNPIQERYVDLKNIDYFQRLKDDYTARLGNVVLGMVKDFKKGEIKECKTFLGMNGDKHIRAARNARSRRNILAHAMIALGYYQRGVQADFQKTVKEIEQDMQFGGAKR